MYWSAPERGNHGLYADGPRRRSRPGAVYTRRKATLGGDAGIPAGEIRFQPAAVEPAAAGSLCPVRFARRADGLDDAINGPCRSWRALPNELPRLLVYRYC